MVHVGNEAGTSRIEPYERSVVIIVQSNSNDVRAKFVVFADNDNS